ncbi:MAG: HAD-IIIA family hydrolase [Paenarthrobacter ureafaciens]|uniref:D-glycero-alpha-D-manno-heptose-1,7-bisphosphate 7-phosphatase n=1 Tax=Paenarthrobacter ureafaciens TaxID=37931 RepID=UPI001AC9FEC8|nr:HAD-IIIA family hydrolase [Paenarthrobacter ureafaciens]MBN9128058.1 HAD-IIIA family hydrolase [Paenarthrobacter ureafaciens]
MSSKICLLTNACPVVALMSRKGYLVQTYARRVHPSMQVAFLDRDGVIIKNRSDYVLDESDVEVLPHAVEAVSWLGRNGYGIILVTNQSAVGRGVLTRSKVLDIDAHVVAQFGPARDVFLATYLCPHAPGARCICRKPMPTMIEHAIITFGAQPTKSFLIGDALTDIEAGDRAGLATGMVLSGRGGTSDIQGLDRFRSKAYSDVFAAAKALHATVTEPR